MKTTMITGKAAKRSQAGITIIETMMAAFILVVGSLAMVGLIVHSIATNNRNKVESTQTMLATSLAEQINSTIIGSGTSNLVDCAGVTHTIDTRPESTSPVWHGGANLSGENIDFTENIAADTTKNNYHMDYVLRTPCTSTGKLQGTFDVRWHINIVGGPGSSVVGGAGVTQSYMITIGAQLKGHGEGNLFFSDPISVRVLSGN